MKRAVAGISAGLLVLSGIAAVATTATADEDFTFVRLAGPDRYGTAADIATKTFQTSDRVLLAAGGQRNFPDALAGNYLAGALDAPLLLTANNSLPQFTRDALTRLQAKTVTILGGTSAVSANVESQLKTAGYTVERISGVDRYATAREVAETPSATGIGTVGTAGRTAILASGQNFPDALAAGPLGYARNLPILITTPGSLSSATRATIESLDIENVIVAGGSTAVSENTENQVKALNGGITTTRLAGSGTQSTRQGTAVAIADFAIDNLGFSNAHVDLARGDDFADALAGGPHSGVNNAPILLTDSANALGVAARDFLRANCQTLTEGHIFGGTAAVSDAVMTAANEAARCGGVTPSPTATATPTSSATPTASTSPTATASPTASATATATVSPSASASPTPSSNQDFVVSPSGAQSTRTSTDGQNEGRLSFTVTGIAGSTVDIVLVPCENVTRDQNGVVSFRDDNEASGAGNNQADFDTTPAVLETVNGVSGTTGSRFDVPVVNGAVQFTVDSQSPTCVVAVVFNGANNNTLDLNADNQPTEDFAVTGDITFLAPAATTTDALDENVLSTDKAANQFVGCEITSDNDGNGTGTTGAGTATGEVSSTTDCATFAYDSTDLFFIENGQAPGNQSSEQATPEQFEAALSPDDDVAGSYNATPSLQSTFTLFNEAPLAPASATAAPTSATATSTIRVAFPESDTPTADSYRVYRALANADTNGAPTTCPAFNTAGTENRDRFALAGTVQDPSPASDGNQTLTFTDTRPEGSSTCYAVTTVDDGDESDSGATTTFATTRTTAQVTAPQSTDARVTTDTDGDLNQDDVLRVIFDEVMSPIVSGDQIQVRDAQGELLTIVCDDTNTLDAGSESATCAFNTANTTIGSTAFAPGRVLTITFNQGTPLNRPDLGAENMLTGANGILDYPVTIVDSEGITDVDNNEWNIAGSPDRIFDVEASEIS